jgi:hypothetical protein
MGFTIICNKCGNKHVIKDKNSLDFDGIDIDVTEECGFQGCTVESIDIHCWKCENEVNI